MQEQETGFISKYNEGLCVNTDPDSILMSILDMSLHRQMGSDRDLQSSASSVSLPSVKKAPKKRRISIGSLFRRKKDNKRKSRELNGGVDGIASIESIHSEICTDKNSIFSTNTSSDNGLTSISKQVGDFIECPLCLLRHSKDRFPEIMTCHHRSCVDCLRQYLRIEISESRVNISCPECTERFNPHDIRLILSDDVLMEKYEEFMLRRWLVADPDCRWCPAPDCGYAVIAFGCASCPKLTCGREGCGTEFCYHCKQIWHPNQTCDAARQERAQSLRLRTIRSSSISYSQESGAADITNSRIRDSESYLADDIKPCPRCAAYIIKMNDGSCNHMTCAVCGCEFCWLCMKEISDLHYLSPSGCTFWGKKPWSRKKKILWQLGTLVGAPVGIALIAGIAIPAMIIGIPVYVGRKIHNRYEGKDVSKHKRNLAIAGGVTLSVIVSPVVAAVTVDTTSVAEARHNPSIGEGSVGGLTGSLSASGSHMDRIGAIRDNLSETASTMALAGASITGSLSGSAMVNCFHRLEVQADVQKERYSLSGESGTVSLGTVSDNASTKAMAGSILNSYIPLDKEGNSMEVQVDIESKPSKFRHNSGSSSVEDGSATRSHPGGSSSGLPEGKSSATKWSKEAAAGKKSKSGKLRKKSNMKINETREDMDAQLLEQQSTNSSEFEAPSLSDSMPSVADSHSSHFSEFSCSDLESMKTSCSHGSTDYHTRFATVNILPEVENDRLENSPHQCSISVLTKTASCSEVPQLNHIAEEHGNSGIKTNIDLYFGSALKEANNNHSHQTVELKVAIQTDI
ncbi:E3 ubiquitin-protein ligase RNF19A isoform X3 [Sagmatias obliquidens]|uniref:RBR-type E3 ubiquitin transferase n=1 Tax=Tursiops truncatus TaxID=9739 RepID=A0A2U4AIJ3_TURTR|nr:E3 ubiquitin-protein ligase RNF19A isoform X3 [Tursiops truncatus]XP_026987316.1 E3 ubiquitin-protein ligase RNF19A isoform X3 [Lagenorhynchus obliquidens]XP_030718859.1 E3 ubiquitin-protein ligase RNF19A isoform X3 [Globicephala melas]